MELYDEQDETGARLVLVGDLDVRSAARVRAAVYDRIDGRDEDLTVDLSAVTSVDLVALRVLAVATRFAERRGRRLTLAGCGPVVLRMLQLSHLGRLVRLDRDRPRAAQPSAEPA